MKDIDIKNFYRVEWAKVGVQLLLLMFLIGTQFIQKDFINWSLMSVNLLLMALVLSFHGIYIYSLEKIKEYHILHYIIFFFDTIWVTILLYYFPNIQALFILLYLIQILLSGILLEKMGAMVIAGFTSLCFSLLLVVSPLVEGQLLFLSLGLNNLGFFLVAILSGTLSEQLRSLGTELEKKTKDIQILKDLNSLIIDNMKSGFISVDANNKILLFNNSAKEILDKDVVEGALLNFIMPEIADKVLAQKQLIKGSPIEHSYRTKKKTKNLLLLVSDIFSDQGTRIGAIIIFSDQTEFKRLEEENKQNEKLAAIGKLAAGIAHEIRNPLASMSGSIQFLADTLKVENADEKKLMQIILKEIDRLNLLVSEFLDFAKPEETKKEELDLGEYIKETLELIAQDPRFSKEIHLNVDIAKGIKIRADKSKIRQVLLNLLINASQAMESTSVKQISLSLSAKDFSAILSIKDSGEGMTKEVKKRLFEPFHTTKPKGTGLGLAMVHKILDHHQASVKVESKVGSGTNFIIDFPLL